MSPAEWAALKVSDVVYGEPEMDWGRQEYRPDAPEFVVVAAGPKRVVLRRPGSNHTRHVRTGERIRYELSPGKSFEAAARAKEQRADQLREAAHEAIIQAGRLWELANRAGELWELAGGKDAAT